MSRRNEKAELLDISQEARLGLGGLIVLAVIALLSSYGRHPAPAAAGPSPAAVPRAVSSIEIAHGDRTKKQVIFTFDAGGATTSADEILAVLAKHRVKGTFFMTGKFVQANPGLVRRIVDSGYEVFDHTYSHPFLTHLSDADIAKQLDMMDGALAAAVPGASSRPYFRAPYGDRDSRVLADAFKDGYESVYWTVDALDWKEPQGETDASVEARILDSLAPGNIYLMHVGDSITGSILDDVFSRIEARGYGIVSLKEGL
ncbi:polysaccharide deacetylase family protein [Patescibacteria group bacterium]|nr:polysaccharide deacetylase family protein [Patescibacteria group bacterium]MDE1940589.1 polysaccharide deacetylase family protein [Patescibacteria group bacterium]